jgi:molybdenum storage protein
MAREMLSTLGQYLVEGSLSDARVLAQTGLEPPLPILPKANVIKTGGQSFIDRGRAAVFPLIEEIAANLGQHDMIIGTGGWQPGASCL